MLPVRDSKFFGGLLHNAGERSVVGVAHEGAEVMCNVMIEAASEPTYDRVAGGVISRCREDVINAVVELVAAGWEVRAVDGVCGLEDE